MKKAANITLIDNSTSGNPPKQFMAQSVEIDYVQPTVVYGATGGMSVARHTTKILWAEGKAADLANITDVKITGIDGGVMIDGELNLTFSAPRDTANGVMFEVLSGR